MEIVIKVDPRYFRPTEVDTLLGDPSKAKSILGWEPSVTVQEMCSEMVAQDLKTAKKNRLLLTHGYKLTKPIEN